MAECYQWEQNSRFISLDFSKAFDLVDHNILIHKLKLYNIDTSWFSSYLYERFQQTHYAGTISDNKEVISGVPQGSVLGPILYLIYVNDLPLSLTSTCADTFADDTTIESLVLLLLIWFCINACFISIIYDLQVLVLMSL